MLKKSGIDYDEIYSPVVSFPSLRATLAEAVDRGMYIHQMDVVNAFGNLEKDIYMDQPAGFVRKGEEHLVRSPTIPLCWNIVL